MIPRYTPNKMGELWSDFFRFQTWLKVELAVIAAKIILGLVKNPQEVEAELNLLKRYMRGKNPKIKIDPAVINKIEAEVTKHDVMAFVRYILNSRPKIKAPRHLVPFGTCWCGLFKLTKSRNLDNLKAVCSFY